jgi:3-oxoacyl-[acyl-carrier protein] reductase
LRDGAFAGETHIVTGAAQGIGLRIAHALAAHGARVALVDLEHARLEAVRAEIAGDAVAEPLVVPCNVTDEEQVRGAVATVLEASGRIHGVVNVAGVTRDARIPRKSFDDFKLVLAVHLYGTFLFTREVAAQHWHPLFKEAGNAPLRDGVNRFVVNFSSVSARNGNVGQIDYTAAKGAIEAATRTTAREFAAYGARVNAIAPGPVNTPMLAAVGDAGIELMAAATLVGRIAEPEDIAAAVCALADARIFGYATGQVFQVNGGLYLA